MGYKQPFISELDAQPPAPTATAQPSGQLSLQRLGQLSLPAARSQRTACLAGSKPAIASSRCWWRLRYERLEPSC
jgi:hypothetical protein